MNVVDNSRDPVMRYDQRVNALVIAKYDAVSKLTDHIRVESDRHILLDFGWCKHGWERLKKGCTYELDVCNVWRIGGDGIDPTHIPHRRTADHVMVGVMQCFVMAHGRVRTIADNDVINAILTEFYEDVYSVAEEACAGLIPIVTFDCLAFKIVKWIVREPTKLGQRNLPIPKRRVNTEQSVSNAQRFMVLTA